MLAASAWLPIYRRLGAHPTTTSGDEAIVDCPTFSLQGKDMKSLRGAYNRVKQGGYPSRYSIRLQTSDRSCGRSCTNS